MSIKKDIIKGVRIFWIFLAFLCLVILSRIIHLQTSDMSNLSQKATKVEVKEVKYLASRGQIYASDGYMLACSLSFFSLYMDCVAPNDSIFKTDVAALGKSLSVLFKDKTAKEYKQILLEARKKGQRYKRLGNRKLNYMETEQVKKFPILKKGANRGGLILKRDILRYRPFGMLGERTIGKLAKNEKGVRVGIIGLEASYENELKGIQGIKKIERAARYRNDYIEKQAVDGNDVYTTLNVDIQDITEKSLKNSLQKFEADHGTAVVMEVKTGDIKAMVNLGIGRDGVYYEKRNYAVEDLVEPGSIFKLASMIALFEDGAVNLSDSIDTGVGVKRFYNRLMKDFHACGKITVQEVFEKSSNVGVSALVYETYKKDPQKYIDRLYDLHLGDLLHLEIKKEGKPFIKEPSNKKIWWGTSLPWMSVGYEVQVTPMHMLTLYNAIANNGIMVKPKLVSAIKQGGKIIRDFSNPIVIDNNICSKKTLRKMKIMLEGVVQRGTAKNLKDDRYKIAGKTGTAHIAKPTGGYDLENYRATFVGYFPAKNPQYSCIVMVEKPNREIGRFGGTVAAPVLKDIADELYSKGLLTKSLPLDSIIDTSITKMKFVKTISENVAMQEVLKTKASTKIVDASVDKMPQVIGMSLRDALFTLEKRGLHVIIKGDGYITEQSIPFGEKVERGQTVILYLS